MLLNTGFFKLSAIVAPNSLATSTEETFHAAEVSDVLSWLLCSGRLLLPVINFTLVLLQVATIVAKF